jgi:DNA topoisomerase-1
MPTKTTSKTKVAKAAKTSATKKTTKSSTKAKKSAVSIPVSDNLVIVESPSKAATLTRMLGKNYTVTASKGHVRDLPKSTMGIDIENSFSPKYVIPKTKASDVNALKKAGASAKCVYLATDPDREGEAIAWHLAETMGLDAKDYKRVVFHEITQEAVDEAFKHPRKIDDDLVNAQQTRRIIDRLVGYNISPILWRKVRKGLSAGRVQSVAVRIIVDREKEIEAFVPKEFWTITADLKKESHKTTFKAVLIGKGTSTKIEINDKKSADAIIKDLEKAVYSVKDITKKEVKKSPNPPFITSTLQQEAWRRFKFSGKRTMALAQQLYEGISVGKDGNVGLITYMRTDSTHIAASAVEETREVIKEKFGDKFLPKTARVYSKKIKGAQEAHEGIRPTKLHREPSMIKSYLTPDQFKLYQLIWQRMISSQMADAVYENTNVNIDAKSGSTTYKLRSTSNVKTFNGFSELYVEQKDDNEGSDESKALPALTEGETLLSDKVDGIQNFTKPPYRYTEATLIKVLEQNGIGRPSTYATIISTIQDREYVVKDAGAFKPTDLGIIVNDLMVNNFSDIVNTDYTAQVEEKLDDIAEGKAKWVDVVKEFYQPLKDNLDKAGSVERVKIPDEPLGRDCPDCGKPMVIKVGRFGKFAACSDYPNCKHTEKLIYKTGIKCPDCPENGELVGRYNKAGKIFYGCSAYPKHKFAINQKPLPEPCPVCGGLMVEYGKSKRCISCASKKTAKREKK